MFLGHGWATLVHVEPRWTVEGNCWKRFVSPEGEIERDRETEREREREKERERERERERTPKSMRTKGRDKQESKHTTTRMSRRVC